MDYIIFDLEWNQSSQPGGVDSQGNALPFEIVEIGAVKLNENRDMIGEFSELIKPHQIGRAIQAMSVVSSRCSPK